ncbi:MAG: pyridoxal phosphate-dependent aminotransferase [Actinobacteria bacterium]|nr:pyridoxal phosphate-dependent aminotransferase [Actinomycetota bacterium]
MNQLKKESAFVVLAKAQEMERQGRDIIHLEIGDTDFDTPRHIVEEAYAQLRAGQTHYVASAGLPELRGACAEFLRRDGRGEYRSEEIVVGPGGKSLLFCAIMAVADPGAEVVYPDPGFGVYESVIRFSGAHPVPIPVLEANDFKITAQDLRDRVNERTRLLVVNYPHNPTGGTLELEDLEQIAHVAIEHDLIVLSDEVYASMLFEGTHTSLATLPGMRERTITLESLSKTYAMTGWRLGFTASPAAIAGELTQLLSNSVSCVPPFIQMAGVRALLGSQEESREMMAAFKQRRDLFVAGLNEIPGISCLTPRGAFYAFPNVAALPMTANEFSDYLLEVGGVATLPGLAFGTHSDDHIRMCFAHSTGKLEAALDRISSAVDHVAG